MEGANVILVDKEDDFLGGASKANSAILHTGFDAPVGSIEQACIGAGYQEFATFTVATIYRWSKRVPWCWHGTTHRLHNLIRL